MSRESGYYWVKCDKDGDYEAANYDSAGDCWLFAGDDGVYSVDDELLCWHEVNEERILTPDEMK